MDKNQKIIMSIVAFVITIIIFFFILRNNLNKQTMEYVSPYVVKKALLNKGNNIILVNVLGDKIPYFISCSGSNNNSMTKEEFNSFIKNNDLSNIDLVILYCASWSCGAAKNYYDELEKKGVDMSKVYDYKGALHEWSMYSILFPNEYSMIDIKSGKNINNQELLKLAIDTKHTYLLKDEKSSKNNFIKNML